MVDPLDELPLDRSQKSQHAAGTKDAAIGVTGTMSAKEEGPPGKNFEAKTKPSTSSNAEAQEALVDIMTTEEGSGHRYQPRSFRHRRSNVALDIERIVPCGKVARVLGSNEEVKRDDTWSTCKSMPDLRAVRPNHQRKNVEMDLRNILPVGKAARVLGPNEGSTTISAKGLPQLSSASAPVLAKSRSYPLKTRPATRGRKKGWFSRPTKPPRIFVIGLAGAGKTSLLAKFGKVKTSSPFNGFEYETVDTSGASLVSWTVDGNRQRITPTWREDTRAGVVFVLDSSDFKHIDKARDVLHQHLAEAMRKLPLLVLATKQDVSRSMSIQQIARRLELNSVQRPWQCQGTSGKADRECVARSLEWLLFELGVTCEALLQTDPSNRKKNFFEKFWRGSKKT